MVSNPKPQASVSARRLRRRRRGRTFIAFRQKTELVHTGGANFVHYGYHVPVFGASVALEKDRFILLVRKAVFHLLGDVGLGYLSVAEENAPVARYRYDDRIFAVGVLHV